MKKIKYLMVLPLLLVLTSSISAEAEDKLYRASIDSDGIQRVEIVGGEYYYEPDHIIVKVNVPVEFIIRKTAGFTPHNILIQAPDAGIDISLDITKDPTPVKFTPSKVGKYPMYCDKRFLFFKNHREKGMEGILEVVE